MAFSGSRTLAEGVYCGAFISHDSRFVALVEVRRPNRRAGWRVFELETGELVYEFQNTEPTFHMQQHYLPFLAQYSLSVNIWSPDSSSFIACSGEDNCATVHRLDDRLLRMPSTPAIASAKEATAAGVTGIPDPESRLAALDHDRPDALTAPALQDQPAGSSTPSAAESKGTSGATPMDVTPQTAAAPVPMSSISPPIGAAGVRPAGPVADALEHEPVRHRFFTARSRVSYTSEIGAIFATWAPR